MSRPWQGIVGRGMTAQEFDAYVSNLALAAWRPKFCVVHNTGVPTFAAWHRVPGPVRMAALERYYRDDQKWSAGPHVFVADDLVWPFTPLYTHGVHSPSWNDISWGVELVGDFNNEAVPAPLLVNAELVLATLHRKGGLDPAAMRIHREDPLTTHKVCPGSRLSKALLISSVQQRLGVSPVPDPFAMLPVLKRGDKGSSVVRLQTLLGMRDLGAGAGVFGPKTERAVMEFQTSKGLVATGTVTSVEWRLLV